MWTVNMLNRLFSFSSLRCAVVSWRLGRETWIIDGWCVSFLFARGHYCGTVLVYTACLSVLVCIMHDRSVRVLAVVHGAPLLNTLRTWRRTLKCMPLTAEVLLAVSCFRTQKITACIALTARLHTAVKNRTHIGWHNHYRINYYCPNDKEFVT